MSTWQKYVREARALLDEAKQHDEALHTEIARRCREEAIVVSNLAIVAALTEEEE